EISGACWRDLGGQGCHAEVAYGIDEAGSQTRRVLNRTAEQSCPFAQALERQEIGTQAEISPDARFAGPLEQTGGPGSVGVVARQDRGINQGGLWRGFINSQIRVPASW